MLRKKVVKDSLQKTPLLKAIDIAATASVMVTSEAAEHPVDHAFDDLRGPGASRWKAGEPGEQVLTLAFDHPQTLHRVLLEIEEVEVQRQQEIEISVSHDGGQSYQEVLRQEYNFSPPGTTFEREEWSIPKEGVTHFRLTIKPDKGGLPCFAAITSLALR